MAPKASKLPKAVVRYLQTFDEDEAGLKDYLSHQRSSFETIHARATDFSGWLALKLSCTRADARTIWKWATGEEI